MQLRAAAASSHLGQRISNLLPPLLPSRTTHCFCCYPPLMQLRAAVASPHLGQRISFASAHSSCSSGLQQPPLISDNAFQPFCPCIPPPTLGQRISFCCYPPLMQLRAAPASSQLGRRISFAATHPSCSSGLHQPPLISDNAFQPFCPCIPPPTSDNALVLPAGLLLM